MDDPVPILPPAVIAPIFVCNKCGEIFTERAAYPGLRVCRLCDSIGAAGIKKRGEAVVCTEGK